MAPARDYYDDLGLLPTATITQIKARYRQLALKHHPDRNPDSIEEAKARFQIIASAHELLSDPQRKAKYDATLGRAGRMGGGSGVRGNPWQDVGQQFPTPPRRNTAARNATSGAQRWQTRFSDGVPPTAKQHAAADPEAKKNAARAFENMRKNQSQGSAGGARRESRPSQPPPPPPRTESSRQRAEASFGAKKTGFHPYSADPGDEPPVSRQSYYTGSSTERPQAPQPPPRKPVPTAVPDPLGRFRDRDGYAADTRQAAPYSSHGGEKTDPFDGVPLSRAKSTRESYRNEGTSTSDDAFRREQMHRSSSVHKSTSMEGAGPGGNVPNEDGSWPHTSDEAPNEYTDTSFKSRTKATYNSEAAHDPAAYAGQVPNTEKYPKPQGYSGGEPSMYATPRDYPSLYETMHYRYPGHMGRGVDSYSYSTEGRSRMGREPAFNPAPSGASEPFFHPYYPYHRNMAFTDAPYPPSFNFSVGADAFERTSRPSDPSRFAKGSVDDINTQFVNDDRPNTWQFSAGNGEQDSSQTGRPLSGGRANRRSPQKRPATQRTESANVEPQSNASSSAFNASGWSDKFGPQTFVPQPTPGAAASPTRSSRANSKKVKPKPTAGYAAVVDDGSGDDEPYYWQGRNAQTKSSAVESPQAMDIDSPPSAPTVPPMQPGSARNINVEPSRPEWRPGNVNTMTGDAGPAGPERIPIYANAAGSEDNEAFRASFADLNNVPPFAQQRGSLRSFTDLKDNLPFESKASEELLTKLPKAQPLDFPTVPKAPRAPQGMLPNDVSWIDYVVEFEDYLRKWDDFNGEIADHFGTRRASIRRTRFSNGYDFLGAYAEGDFDMQDYYIAIQQDNDVRRRWTAACEEHEQRFREFMMVREKMK